MTRCRAKARTEIFELEQEYQNKVERLADVKRHEDLFLLREAKVVYRFIKPTFQTTNIKSLTINLCWTFLLSPLPRRLWESLRIFASRITKKFGNRFKRIMKFFGNVDNGTLMKPPIFCNLVLLLPIFYSIYNLWIQEIFLKDSLSLFDSFFFTLVLLFVSMRFLKIDNINQHLPFSYLTVFLRSLA